ncbi:uncharacterized protein LOC129876613 [Solanum dulcamara]|uniref:uncharacterized protein LOC129876613 n=1 Tax=Solanum dulcamara TaxID=45834 RepID=UPI002485C4FE|nr:uncharacterized protein LOC129876613 [Solanum dulcamara]XP_055808066.1 uncharacterized protein LOC129876613 [Solanum dulcamara]
MSGGQIRKISREDIQLVQNLIERCLQLYMNQKEAVGTLLQQAKIDPSFTELVWQKLEEENHEFFRAYYVRLIVKNQIMRFNDMLERQVKSMHMYATGSIPMSNGSQIQPVAQNSTFQATEHAGPNMKLGNMHQTINGNLPHLYTNGVSSVQSYAQAAMDVSVHARSIDASPNMLLPQNANLGMMLGPNEGMIKSAGYSGKYGGEGILLQASPGIGNPSLPNFSNVEPSVQPVNEDPWGADTSSFGFLGKIPRNFSLSDLTADFPDSSDILEGYSGSAFLATDTNDFLDPQGKGEQEHQAINGLDTISEDVSFEDLASD